MKRGPKQREDVGPWPLMKRLILDEIGESQNQQAEALGVSQSAVGGWRSSRSRPPQSVIERLALCALASLPEKDRKKAVRAGLKRMREL